MTDMIKNSMPFVYYTGTQDVSGRTLPVVDEERPMHCPFIFTLAERGETTPFIARGPALAKMLGDKTFDPRGQFFGHTTAFLTLMNELANACMVERIKPEGAKTSTLQVALDLLPTEVPTYNRLPDGSFELDDTGAKIPTGSTVPGHIGRFIVRPITGAIGAGTEGVGSQVDGATQSIIYPLFEFKVWSFGKFGDNYGIRLYPLYSNGVAPVDEELVYGEKALMLRLEVVERVNPRVSPVAVRTLTGSPSVDFMLKEGTLNTRTDSELFIDEVALQAYRDLRDYSSGIPSFGPFEQIYTYHENVAKVSKMIHEAEIGFSPIGEAGDIYLANIFQGRRLNGAPYESYVVQGVLDGGISLNAESIHYCLGGSDGDTSPEAFDAAVFAKLSNFGEGEYLYGNKARYPFSAFYDTGFGMETKLAIPKILGVRPNVHVTLATQVVGAPNNTIAEDSSVAISLRAAIRAQPESTFFGTGAFRGVVVGHAGRLANSKYKKFVPGTFEIGAWRAEYCGAGNGKMKSAKAYDENPNNMVRYLIDVTNLDKPVNVRNRDWDNGLVWFEDYDTRRAFCPMVSTVYNDDTSILKADINMQIAVELNTVAFLTWRRLVGNSRLTKEQFIKRSDEILNDYIRFRFDNRGEIRPRTFYTPADDARGFSWSVELHFYGNNAKAVNTATVVTHRLEDLTQ